MSQQPPASQSYLQKRRRKGQSGPMSKRSKYNPASRSRRSLYRSSVTASTYRFKRTYLLGVNSTDGVNPFLVAYNFSLNDVPGSSELYSLFSFYKITGCRFRMFPEQIDSNSTANTNNARPAPLIHCIDKADGTAPGTVNALCEYNNHSVACVTDGVDIYFNPMPVDPNGQQILDEWITTAKPAIDYLGVKVAIPAVAAAIDFYVLWTIYVSFKQPK